MIKVFSHIILSSLLILSSAGLTINMHFCQDELIDLAVIAPANSCCEVGEKNSCCHQESDANHSSECSDESIEISSSSDFNITISAFEFSNDHSLDLFLTNHSLAGKLRIAETASFEKSISERPPLISEVDLPQIQSFLI